MASFVSAIPDHNHDNDYCYPPLNQLIAIIISLLQGIKQFFCDLFFKKKPRKHKTYDDDFITSSSSNREMAPPPCNEFISEASSSSAPADTEAFTIEIYQRLYQNLTLIASLQKGEKLHMTIPPNQEISIDRSYVPYISRWWYNQSGIICINFIEEQINAALKYACAHHNGILMHDKLQETKNGLINLKSTYVNRKEIITKLDQLIEKINLLKV